jgi:3-hydroxybutyryl-CoA dehydrogenase
MTDSLNEVTVLGAGTMGRGIAQVAAAGGYRTCLFDIESQALHDAEQTIRRNLEKGVALGKLEPDIADRARQNLWLADDLTQAVADAELVIEAAPESMPLKLELFDKVGRYAPADCYLASNTSGLSITEMATASGRPDRFAGMHFFNPVHLMRLVELVRGLETSDETMNVLAATAETMGKQVVTVRESPGFVTSRINALIGNEAFRMLEQGVASARDIDTALKLGLNHPMGPFEMVDLVGLDVRLSILEHLHRTLGDLYRPSNLLIQFVGAGRLGRKTGRGVYQYDANGKIID